MFTIFKKVVLLSGLILLATSLDSCRCQNVGERLAERIAEKAIEKQSGGKVNVDINKEKGQITIQGDSGQTKLSIGESTDLSGLPPELVYPGAVSEGVVKTETGTEKSVSVGLKSKDGLANIETHYAGVLKGGGWTQKGRWEATQDGETVITFSYEKETKSLMMWLKRDKDDTESSISIIHREKK